MGRDDLFVPAFLYGDQRAAQLGRHRPLAGSNPRAPLSDVT
ncbi:hypothetical protein V474_24095 [Novosphingobium barchaimii LL02]|uniref:Uncharacterized protein n=1 Tax=Novosphingobium barchaimii LL02 TaxID=1114963 RepID=A0A0J7XLT0_9SPHN|nr:hypothetical protein V474_24095 [Novosphingobium barchaimii LL02]